MSGDKMRWDFIGICWILIVDNTLFIIYNMSNSIKQLINLLASFIDKTFIPLIDNKTA